MEELVLDKAIVYYTTNLLEGTLLGEMVKVFIEDSELPIYSVSQKPMDFGNNFVYPKVGRSHSLYYGQIMMGLEKCPAKYVFFCEHDVLYHPSHFEFTPPTDDKVYYNHNVMRYHPDGNRIVSYDTEITSQLCANRELLIKHYQDRMEYIKAGNKGYGFEPGSGQSKKIDGLECGVWKSEYPNIDIRHNGSITGVERMYPDQFRKKPTNFKVHDVHNIPGWGEELLWI